MARRLGVLAAMLLVIGLSVWAGIINLRARRRAMQQAQVVLVKEGGTNAMSESEMPGMGVDLRGKPAPPFSLQDTMGKKVSLEDYKGKPVVVNFWATWCGPCKLEMPWFEEFAQKYKDQGLVVLGISEDEGTPKEQISAAAKKIGVSYPILLPDEKTSKAYGGVDYLPETFYVGRSGSIVAETAGAPSKDEMEANIRKVIAAGGM